MSSRSKRERVRKEVQAYWHSGGFAGIPRIVIEHADYLGLSHCAKTLLTYFAYQFRGNNNGDLSAPHSALKEWGIASKSTLKRALDELQAANLIRLTRAGRFMNPGGTCSLYALTWLAIDECEGKLDIPPTSKPLRSIALERAKSKMLSTVIG